MLSAQPFTRAWRVSAAFSAVQGVPPHVIDQRLPMGASGEQKLKLRWWHLFNQKTGVQSH